MPQETNTKGGTWDPLAIDGSVYSGRARYFDAEAFFNAKFPPITAKSFIAERDEAFETLRKEREERELDPQNVSCSKPSSSIACTQRSRVTCAQLVKAPSALRGRRARSSAGAVTGAAPRSKLSAASGKISPA